MSNIIPPLVSTSPPPINGTIAAIDDNNSTEENVMNDDDEEEDDFGNFTSASIDCSLALSISTMPQVTSTKFFQEVHGAEELAKDYQDKRKCAEDINDEVNDVYFDEEPPDLCLTFLDSGNNNYGLANDIDVSETFMDMADVDDDFQPFTNTADIPLDPVDDDTSVIVDQSNFKHKDDSIIILDQSNLQENEVELQENDVNLMETEVNQRESEFNLKEIEVIQQEKEVDLQENEFNLKEKGAKLKEEVKFQEGEVNQQEVDVNLKENEFNLKEAVNLQENEVNLQENEVNPKENEFNLQGNEANLNQKEVNLKEKEFNLSESEFKLKGTEFKLKENESNILENKVNLKENEVNLNENEFNPKEIECNLRENEVKGDETDDSVNDDFGDFNDHLKPAHDMSLDTVLSNVAGANNPQHLQELIEQLYPLDHMHLNKPIADNDQPSQRPIVMQDDTIFDQLKDITDTRAITFTWNKSTCQAALLNALNIDTRNILPAWSAAVVPKFAATLGSAPLEPIKSDVTSMGTSMTIAQQQQRHHHEKVAEGGVIPRAQFDWSVAGLTDPLTDCDSPTVRNVRQAPPATDVESVQSLELTDENDEDERRQQQLQLKKQEFSLRESHITATQHSNEPQQQHQEQNKAEKVVDNDDDDFADFQMSLPAFATQEDVSAVILKPTVLSTTVDCLQPQQVRRPQMQQQETHQIQQPHPRIHQMQQPQQIQPHKIQQPQQIQQPAKTANHQINEQQQIINWPDPGLSDADLVGIELSLNKLRSRVETKNKTRKIVDGTESIGNIDDKEENEIVVAKKEAETDVGEEKEYETANEKKKPPSATSTTRLTRLAKEVMAKEEEDDNWTDFVGGTTTSTVKDSHHHQQQQQIKGKTTSAVDSLHLHQLSVPQLNNLQPPRQPIPVITAHGLIQTKIPTNQNNHQRQQQQSTMMMMDAAAIFNYNPSIGNHVNGLPSSGQNLNYHQQQQQQPMRQQQQQLSSISHHVTYLTNNSCYLLNTKPLSNSQNATTVAANQNHQQQKHMQSSSDASAISSNSGKAMNNGFTTISQQYQQQQQQINYNEDDWTEFISSPPPPAASSQSIISSSGKFHPTNLQQHHQPVLFNQLPNIVMAGGSNSVGKSSCSTVAIGSTAVAGTTLQSTNQQRIMITNRHQSQQTNIIQNPVTCDRYYTFNRTNNNNNVGKSVSNNIGKSGQSVKMVVPELEFAMTPKTKMKQ